MTDTQSIVDLCLTPCNSYTLHMLNLMPISRGCWVYKIYLTFVCLPSVQLPEIRSLEESASHDNRQTTIQFIVHCSGMIFGFLCILAVVLISDYINF